MCLCRIRHPKFESRYHWCMIFYNILGLIKKRQDTILYDKDIDQIYLLCKMGIIKNYYKTCYKFIIILISYLTWLWTGIWDSQRQRFWVKIFYFIDEVEIRSVAWSVIMKNHFWSIVHNVASRRGPRWECQDVFIVSYHLLAHLFIAVVWTTRKCQSLREGGRVADRFGNHRYR